MMNDAATKQALYVLHLHVSHSRGRYKYVLLPTTPLPTVLRTKLDFRSLVVTTYCLRMS